MGNVLGVALPAAGLVAAIVLLWGELVGVEALAIALAMYLLTGGLGISVGFHRLFTHRSFEAARAVRFTLAVLGTMAMMGPIIRWVTNHRKHHTYTDEDGDPHSPHLTGHAGLRGAVLGLWHAHVGWIFETDRSPRERYAPDLLADPLISFVDRTSALWVLLGLALPFGAGYALSGTVGGALTALLWGGPVRIFVVHHMTFAINSLCHFAGRRRFVTDDESRNVGWLAALTFGESWHNNHHAFPTSPFHGLRKRELDFGRLVIIGLERVGLAWNLRRVSPERQQLRLGRGGRHLRVDVPAGAVGRPAPDS
jgi:stearoyl-CoA desaturase (delta-9 desaturase)